MLKTSSRNVFKTPLRCPGDQKMLTGKKSKMVVNKSKSVYDRAISNKSISDKS